MLEQVTVVNNQEQQEKEKRAKGVFPRLSLSKALELPRAILEMGDGEQVRRLSVLSKLGRSPESSSSRTLISVSNGGYGLVIGGYNAPFLGITERGRQIVGLSDDVTRYKAIYDALYENEIFTAFMTRYLDRSMPIDEVAIDFLKKNFKLSEPDAKTCLDVIKENVTDFGLVETYSGRQVLVSRQTALGRLGIPTSTTSANNSSNGSEPEDVAPVMPSVVTQSLLPATKKIEPQFHFNIQIQIPDNASPEAYDAIFKSMATYLLGRGEE